MSDTTAVRAAPRLLNVVDKHDGALLAQVPQHTVEDVQAMIVAASASTSVAAALPRHERGRILEAAAAALEARTDEAARLIVAEAGKTIRQATKEVGRAVNTLRLSAAEARRNVGEVVPFDSVAGPGRQGWFTREPLGLIAAITPYNDPLNLVAHKLGPAIAGGNTIILKPSQLTPLSGRLLAELLFDAGLPQQALRLTFGDRMVAQALVSARAVRMVSFTGGFRTAEAITAIAGVKRLSMELGGNAPVLVFDDADLGTAVSASVSGAFWAAGQNCIGAQRILVQDGIYDEFVARFVAATGALVVGDPTDASTDVGPMISADAAWAARASLDEAVLAGATVLVGGTVQGSALTPAVVVDVPRTCGLWRDEVFAPIVIIEPFVSEDDGLQAANDSEYALQAGVFTTDLQRALRVSRAIDAGGVMVNDSSDYRLDAMPFGGSKYGSMGREGVRFAYEEMTQTKVVAIAT